MPNRRYGLDPIGNYNFFVDGISIGIFNAVDGLNYEVDMIEYRVSDQPMLTRFRPGLPKSGRITLKRGFLPNVDFIMWMEDIQNGKYERKDAAIQLMDNAAGVNMIWNCFRCLPAKWSLNGFDGKGNDLAIESIEMVVEEVMLDTSLSSYVRANLGSMGRQGIRDMFT